MVMLVPFVVLSMKLVCEKCMNVEVSFSDFNKPRKHTSGCLRRCDANDENFYFLQPYG